MYILPNSCLKRIYFPITTLLTPYQVGYNYYHIGISQELFEAYIIISSTEIKAKHHMFKVTCQIYEGNN